MARILFVEDDVERHGVYLGAAHALGHDAEIVDSALLALDLLRNGEKFDLIISDFDMSEMNGLDFLQEVKDKFPGVPLALYTGNDEESIVTKCAAMDIRYYKKGAELSIIAILRKLLPK